MGLKEKKRGGNVSESKGLSASPADMRFSTKNVAMPNTVDAGTKRTTNTGEKKLSSRKKRRSGVKRTIRRRARSGSEWEGYGDAEGGRPERPSPGAWSKAAAKRHAEKKRFRKEGDGRGGEYEPHRKPPR